MRRVKVYKNVYKNGGKVPVKVFDREGNFIEYGVDYEEFESGPGNYSCAIVEMDDGTVGLICLEFIEFILESDDKLKGEGN